MPSLKLAQSPRKSYASVFSKTEREADRLGITKHLESMAEGKGYEGGMDWLLLFLRPEFEGPYRDYRKGSGRSFKEDYPKLVKPLDQLMCAALKGIGVKR